MSNNLENDRSVTTGKMYPIDLAAPQKITIVKSMSNTEVKMAHLISGQPKTTGASQIITHTGPIGLMRTAAQIVSPGVASQPQMIVSGAPILQGTQIVSQGAQLMGQNSQIISQSQLIGPSGQILSPATQIISQGTQLSAQVSNSNSTGASNTQVSVASAVSAAQVLSVGGQLSVVSSTVRTLPPSVRVLPTLPHHNSRPVLSSVNVSSAGGVLVSKGVTSHVPRGLAAGASLAVRPVAPSAQPTLAQTNNNAWSGSGRGRSALVYGGRAPLRSAAPPHSAIVTLPTTTVLTSSGVISSSTPAPTAPRPLPLLQRNYQPAKAHTQVVGVASVGVRGAVGNSAPPQLYYEVPRAPRPSLTSYTHQPTHQTTHQPTHQTTHQPTHQPTHLATHQPTHQPVHQPTHQPVLAPTHVSTHQQSLQPVLQPTHQVHQPTHQISHQPTHQQSVNIVNTVQTLSEIRQPTTPISNAAVLPRPSILRKREVDGSPSKNTVSAIAAGLVSVGTNLTSTLTVNNVGVGVGNAVNLGGISINNIGIGAVNLGSSVTLGGVTLNTVQGCTTWEEPGGRGSGSTTESAASSAEDEPEPPPHHDRSPRKKPRKQMLSSEVRHCEFPSEDAPPTPPPPVTVIPIPKRPLLSSSYVCGWRGTALHFARPADVRRREPRARDLAAIAAQKHVLTSAEGWKVHHLTAQMDDLVLLEADVGEQLAGVLRAIESASGRALAAMQPHSHALLELIKGNIQRSKIVCEGIQEAREDILRVFKHRNFVSDILTRQADKRCFRKHRSQS
ncbi:uncharacterized protein [Epargyreus clarus]|uniref:uncharacterized protein n=1 Tax=Epargyreus clarus TaxID=520877 RepID=UPI003C30349F